MVTQFQILNQYYDERANACIELESVISKLLRFAVIEQRKYKEMMHAEELYLFTQRQGHIHGMEVGDHIVAC